MNKITIDALKNIIKQYNFTELHIHHTATPANQFDGSNHIKIQSGMRDYHVNRNGWRDIGQHLTLFPDGVFVTGRDFNFAPASATGHNGADGVGKHPLSVEMLGNFQKNMDVLGGKQLDSILDLARAFDELGKPVRFHREMGSTACPGETLNKADFMALVRLPKKIDTFPDLVGRWSEADVREVIESGIMSGHTDGTFKPTDMVTREELAVVVNRLLKKLL